MAFDHWWFGALVDESGYRQLEPAFAEAANGAVLSSGALAALQSWRDRPADYEEAAITTDEAAALVHEFIWAFNLPGFDRLAEQCLTQGGMLSGILSEETLIRMVITARTTPVSILWHALGPERAGRLPGQMGNVILRPGQIDDAAEMTRRAYAGVTTESLLDKARRYCGASVSDETLLEVLGFLPEGLARAKERRHGFLALARAQI